MSAAVASMPGEEKIYISTATLQLKVNTKDYVWQTEVLTPPPTPAAIEADVIAERLNKSNAAGSVGSAAPTSAAATVGAAAVGAAGGALHEHIYSSIKKKPAPKPVPIQKTVTNFMEAERYHTENIQNMNQFVSKV